MFLLRAGLNLIVVYPLPTCNMAALLETIPMRGQYS